MTEKQVILSKVEYDKMEQELKDLTAIVNSRKISAVITTYGGSWASSNYSIQYIHGIEESDAVAVLDHEIKSLKKQIDEGYSRAFKDRQTIKKLEDWIEAIKQKPWYKRIFSI